MNKNIYFFIGTTAELIKVSPVLNELQKRSVDYKIITSGQNYVNFVEFEKIIGKQKVYYSFELNPINLPLPTTLHFFIWGIRSLIAYLSYFRKEFKSANKENTYFIIHGDTVSAFLGALVAKLFGPNIAHIESGYRSFNFLEPFPEEISRFLISLIADTHFPPNEWCLKNLRYSHGDKINTLLNTAYESIMKALSFKQNFKQNDLLTKGRYYILILHRQEHILFQKELSKKYINLLTSFASKDLRCLFILHKMTDQFLKEQGLSEEIENNQYITTISRLPYIDFAHILDKSEFIASDGGGNQQEAYFLGKPCLILRDHVEGIEGIGSNAVIAKNSTKTINDFITNYKNYSKNRVIPNVLPSKIIVNYLINN